MQMQLKKNQCVLSIGRTIMCKFYNYVILPGKHFQNHHRNFQNSNILCSNVKRRRKAFPNETHAIIFIAIKVLYSYREASILYVQHMLLELIMVFYSILFVYIVKRFSFAFARPVCSSSCFVLEINSLMLYMPLLQLYMHLRLRIC